MATERRQLKTQVRVAAQPQRVGLVFPEVGKLTGPFRVSRAHQPDPRLAEGLLLSPVSATRAAGSAIAP